MKELDLEVIKETFPSELYDIHGKMISKAIESWKGYLKHNDKFLIRSQSNTDRIYNTYEIEFIEPDNCPLDLMPGHSTNIGSIKGIHWKRSIAALIALLFGLLLVLFCTIENESNYITFGIMIGIIIVLISLRKLVLLFDVTTARHVDVPKGYSDIISINKQPVALDCLKENLLLATKWENIGDIKNHIKICEQLKRLDRAYKPQENHGVFGVSGTAVPIGNVNAIELKSNFLINFIIPVVVIGFCLLSTCMLVGVNYLLEYLAIGSDVFKAIYTLYLFVVFMFSGILFINVVIGFIMATIQGNLMRWYDGSVWFIQVHVEGVKKPIRLTEYDLFYKTAHLFIQLERSLSMKDLNVDGL